MAPVIDLNESQKLIFARLCREEKDLLFGSFSSTVNHRARDNAWKQIQEQMAAHGVIAEAGIFRKQAWENLKKNARRHYDNSKKSGARGKLLSQVDEVVLDVIGRDSASTVGMGLPDPLPVLSGQSHNRAKSAVPKQDQSSILMPPPSSLPAHRDNRGSSFLDLNHTVTSLDHSMFVPERSSSPVFGNETLTNQTLPSIDGRTATPSIRRVRSVVDSEATHLPQQTISNENVAQRPNLKRRRFTSVDSLLTDFDFKSLKKDVMTLQREQLMKNQDEQEMRLLNLRQQLDDSKKTSELKFELLKLDLEARKSEIQKNLAMAAFFASCSKAVDENRLTFPGSEYTVQNIIIKAMI